MNSLQMYDIQSTLIIYDAGLKKLIDAMNSPLPDAVDALIEVEGQASLNRYCGNVGRKFMDVLSGVDSYSEAEDGVKYKWRCLMPWMRRVLEFRHGALHRGTFANKEAKIEWTTTFLRLLEKKVDLDKLLSWIGKDNYFFQIKVSGFRTHDENGDSEYISDSVGSFNQNQGGGVFRDFASKYGILSSELTARYLSDGY
jgi:hypothetical protein